MRERAEQEIVRQRVEELLHPEKIWDPEGEVRDSPSSVGPATGAAKNKVSSPPNATANPAQVVWMTDIAAARAEATRDGRLLLLYFRPKPSPSRQKQETDMAGSPSVQKVLRHFILVAIDTSDSANQQLMEEYRVSDKPKVVVTDAGGEPQYMTEKVAFRDRLDMDELRQDLSGLVQRYLAERSESADDATTRSEAPSSASARAGRGDVVLPDEGKNPRDALLEAESAVVAALAAVATAEKSCTFSQTDLKRTQELFQKGAVSDQGFRKAEKQASDDDARLEKAKLDLQHAERQATLARENLASRLKLLEFDMADAKLRIEHLAKEEQRAQRLFESAAMSHAEYDESKLALERAKLQLRRLTALMELYAKPIPGPEPPKVDDGGEEEPKGRGKKDVGGTSPRR
jgi:hypothetical protein